MSYFDRGTGQNRSDLMLFLYSRVDSDHIQVFMITIIKCDPDHVHCTSYHG